MHISCVSWCKKMQLPIKTYLWCCPPLPMAGFPAKPFWRWTLWSNTERPSPHLPSDPYASHGVRRSGASPTPCLSIPKAEKYAPTHCRAWQTSCSWLPLQGKRWWVTVRKRCTRSGNGDCFRIFLQLWKRRQEDLWGSGTLCSSSWDVRSFKHPGWAAEGSPTSPFWPQSLGRNSYLACKYWHFSKIIADCHNPGKKPGEMVLYKTGRIFRALVAEHNFCSLVAP